ncbi:uncharacterized protein LOC141661017 [Apium graveolens]|uniref:uncharacterized protein LOC141661017 n=1 Tax=Apium graveolens TaxID=4045 RepID=UPI003D78F81B
MEELRSKLNFEGFIAVEPQGKSGGYSHVLARYGEGHADKLSKNYIDILINMGENKEWRLTGIYGEPSRTEKFKTYELLRNLSRDANLPWCLIGDFNNVTSQVDKRGGAAYPNNLIEGFNEGLFVLSYIIKDQWEEDIHYSISQKVKKCADSLDIWGREITSYFGKRIKECKIKLKVLRRKRDTQSMDDYESTKKQVHLILDQIEIFWRKRLKQLRLQAGEKNTKYFQASYSKRKRNNHIQRLKSEAGDWVGWNEGCGDMIQNYFQQLFTVGTTHTDKVLSCISRVVT